MQSTLKTSRSFIDLLNPQVQNHTQPISIQLSSLHRFQINFIPNSLPTDITKPIEKKIDKDLIIPQLNKIDNIENPYYPDEDKIREHLLYLTACQFKKEEFLDNYAIETVNALQHDQKYLDFKL